MASPPGTLRPTMKLTARLLLVLLLPLCTADLHSAEWSVPLAGNAYRTAPAPGGEGFSRGGGIAWGDTNGVFSVLFHVSQPATLELALHARVPEGRSRVVTRVLGQSFTNTLEGAEFATNKLGRIEVPAAGYVRVDLQGQERTGRVYAEIRDLLVSSDSAGLALDYVKTNQGNMFYWGRRGPSVHLNYQLPRDRKLTYAYSEITVPEGQDPIGSYFMANGFGEGYFGMQVNSPTERRIIFSVWDAGAGGNAKDRSTVSADDQTQLLGKGEGVVAEVFGNEGTGGHSHLVYNWKTGSTQRFYVAAALDGTHTIYSGYWFHPERKQWQLIASFRAPKDGQGLRRLYSFSENFGGSTGHLVRKARFGPQWIRLASGAWQELTTATFSHDATGKENRLDRFMGVEEGRFFLQHGGFVPGYTASGAAFSRPATGAPPQIELPPRRD